MPHINIKLEDLAGNELKDKHVGIIIVKSKSNSNGYFEIKNKKLEIIPIKE